MLRLFGKSSFSLIFHIKMSRKRGVESGRRRSMTPNVFFEFHIRILKVIWWRSKKKLVGLEITGPYLLKSILSCTILLIWYLYTAPYPFNAKLQLLASITNITVFLSFYEYNKMWGLTVYINIPRKGRFSYILFLVKDGDFACVTSTICSRSFLNRPHTSHFTRYRFVVVPAKRMRWKKFSHLLSGPTWCDEVILVEQLLIKVWNFTSHKISHLY